MKTLIYISLTIIFLSSCSTQNLFQKQSYNTNYYRLNPYVHVLKKDDKISVSIWNHDELSIGSVYGIYNSNEVYGKWVLIDNKGNVNLPVIKTVKLEGLTLDEAKDTLSILYGEFIKDPIIEIKVLNLQVTILGEVKSPGNYILEKNENHLIELIGRAGGLDDYANSSKIKIIRGDLSKGKTHTILIDLTDISELETGKMNIYPNDVIYISSKKGKMLDKKAPTLIPFASALSAIAIIIAIVFKKG